MADAGGQWWGFSGILLAASPPSDGNIGVELLAESRVELLADHSVTTPASGGVRTDGNLWKYWGAAVNSNDGAGAGGISKL